jgi:hypothetical protein
MKFFLMYFDARDLFQIFYNLNSRINTLIKSFHHLKRLVIDIVDIYFPWNDHIFDDYLSRVPGLRAGWNNPISPMGWDGTENFEDHPVPWAMGQFEKVHPMGRFFRLIP